MCNPSRKALRVLGVVCIGPGQLGYLVKRYARNVNVCHTGIVLRRQGKVVRKAGNVRGSLILFRENIINAAGTGMLIGLLSLSVRSEQISCCRHQAVAGIVQLQFRAADEHTGSIIGEVHLIRQPEQDIAVVIANPRMVPG